MRRGFFIVLFMLLTIGLTFLSISTAHSATYQSHIVALKQDPSVQFTNADLNGIYWFRRLGIEDFETAGREATVVWGYIDFNGSGQYSLSFDLFDSHGSSSSGGSNGTYVVHSDGSFDLSSDNPSETVKGFIAGDPDRSFAIILSSISDSGGTEQGLVVVVKTPATTTVSDLSGSWRIHELSVSDIESGYPSASTCMAKHSFNGGGGFNGLSICFESDGLPECLPISGNYAFVSDQFEFTVPGEPVIVKGYLSKNRDILITSQGTQEPGGGIRQVIGAALKLDPSKTFTAADLAGTYSFVEIALQDMGTGNRKASVSHGDIAFHCDYTWDGSYTSYWSDGTTESGPNSGTYTVRSDGSLSTTVSGAPIAFHGVISVDGNVAILSTPGQDSITCSRSNPSLQLLLLFP